MKPKLLLLFSLLILFACSKEESFAPADYAVSGKVEKGPFASGSVVTLEPLDGKLNPLGGSFTTTVKDDEGNFDWGNLKLESPYVLLTATGRFFDELRGELSAEAITLQAIADLTEQKSVNINLLTHLKIERLRRLIASGRSYDVANRQAQGELLESFALQSYADTDASRFSMAEGTNEAAALILLSSALWDDRSEAEFTKYITRLTKEFAFGGTFSDPVKREYRYAAVGLQNRFSTLSDHLVKHYEEQGKEVTVKDLSYFVDWDKDGIAGNELGDPDVEKILEFETEKLDIPMEGGTFTVKINANVPYSFTDPVDDGHFRALPEPSNPLFREHTVSYKQELEQDVLTFTVEPASNRVMSSKILRLYRMDGKVCSALLIKQQGDPTKKQLSLTEQGKDLFTRYCNEMSIVLGYCHMEEGMYTKLYQTSDELLESFKHLPLLPSNFMLDRGWSFSYSAFLRNQRAILWMGDAYSSLLTPYLVCADAAMYYEMAVLWGHVIYLQGDDALTKNSRQLNEKELFAELSVYLKQGLATFEEKKNSFENVGDMFLLSKDVPRALLAKMYLYQGEYRQAYPLLKEIVETRHYQMESSRSRAMGRNSREIIYGLFAQRNAVSVDSPFYILESGDERVPAVTYGEVLLSLAECAYQLGEASAARNYLNQVVEARGCVLPDTGDDFITSLQKVWASELKGTGTYFAFLKRNRLAQTLLGLEEYMLLLPIPQEPIDRNPALKQNPGYGR